MTWNGCHGFDCDRDDGFICPEGECRIEQGLVPAPIVPGSFNDPVAVQGFIDWARAGDWVWRA